jgi:hypothetical protein
MTLPPLYLLDTCTLINLTYSQPVSDLIQSQMSPHLGWMETVKTELQSIVKSQNPIPNSIQALRWGLAQLGTPIVIEGNRANGEAILEIRASIGLADGGSPFQHLGEATIIHHLVLRGEGFLISDDHGARSAARARGVKAVSSVGLANKFMGDHSKLSAAEVDQYLGGLRNAERMRVSLTASDLMAGDFKGWR